jgi:hypothetical protein
MRFTGNQMKISFQLIGSVVMRPEALNVYTITMLTKFWRAYQN